MKAVTMEREKSLGGLQDDRRMRIDSKCSVDSGFEALEHLEPLDLEDVRRFSADISRSGDSGNDDSEDDFPNVSLFSVAMMMIKKAKMGNPISEFPKKHRTRAAKNWVKALGVVKDRGDCDPWDVFNLDALPVEEAIRHKYHGLAKEWTRDNVFVRIDDEPFDQGAMRECCRMKKMDKYCPNADWKRDSNNYVAKRYKAGTESDRQTYFDDVCLQMDAKLWGEEYNRHNPPKKVDIFMVSVYEFTERPGSPLFHVEHFIEGDYIKYNSNSGFVDNRICRQTPQAFSHFTFECSGHELIVVDVQGVGDLYTDPQIHTVDGKDYGSGNLGAKGMSLFFHSHNCNSICKRLGLSPFALSKEEQQAIHSNSSSSTSTSICQTVLRGHEVALGVSPSEDAMSTHLQAFFRNRSISTTNDDEDSPRHSFTEEEPFNIQRRESVQSSSSLSAVRHRGRRVTETFDEGSVLAKFREHIRQKKRPACLSTEMGRTMQAYDDSVLGLVHLELAKYHEICRFTDNGCYDKAAAFFHLKAAADCGVVDAIVNVARIYCGLPHDILSDVRKEDCPAEDEEDAIHIGLDYMERAASAGVRAAMVYIAQAFDTGLNLANPEKDRSVATALYWYEEIQEYDRLATEDKDKAEWGMADPPYFVLARQAEIWLMDDVDNVKKAPQRAAELYSLAAESAQSCMKGKLANKYYMLAEEAYEQVE